MLWAQWHGEKKLTDNSVVDTMPDVDMMYGDPTIVWLCNDSVMVARFWGGVWPDPERVTPDTMLGNSNPSIGQGWGTEVAWKSQTLTGWSIFYHNPSIGIETVASSAEIPGSPRISTGYERHIVWEGWDGNDLEICCRRRQTGGWDTVDTLTSNSCDDRNPSIATTDYTDFVAWQVFDGNDWEIACRVFNGTTWDSCVLLTNNSTDDKFPSVSETVYAGWPPPAVVWQHWDGSDWEICIRTCTGGIWDPETLLTDNDVDDEKPSIEGGLIWNAGNRSVYAIAWQRWDGEDYEIVCSIEDEFGGWDPEIQLSEEDGFDDVNPRVAVCQTCPIKDSLWPGICVVWEGYDESDCEIYYSLGFGSPEGGAEEGTVPSSTLWWKQISESNKVSIGYYVPHSGHVGLDVYDAAGRRVTRLVADVEDEGEKNVLWLAPRTGVYFVQLRLGKQIYRRKITILEF
jgi:hypothetical protein